MMKKISTTALILSLAAPAMSALAADTGQVEIGGLVEVGALFSDINSNNSARFEEYRDFDDGIIGRLQLALLKDDYFLHADGEDLGRDDQEFHLDGGQYGNFKYKLYFDEMPHNYSFNSLSFYNGLGTNRLVLIGDPTTNLADSFETSTATWNVFDYSVQHKKYGGEFELSLRSPFFLSVGAEQRTQDGTRPFSVRENIEAPYPVSYTTDNANIKAGYLGENISASLTGSISSFENDNKFLLWDDPSPDRNDLANVTQNAVLDPDNDLKKLAGDFTWRSLPLGSTLAVSGSYANLSNSFTADEVNVSAVTLDSRFRTAFANLNQTFFDGDIDYISFSTALVSRPLAKLDSKIYYRYQQKDNNSSRIFYDDETGDNAKELLSYDKNAAGIDLGYQLPFRTKVNAGYEYDSTDRSTELPAFIDVGDGTFYRYDNPESTTDNTVFVKLKNSSLDWLTPKLKYRHLERDSDFTGIYDPYNNLGVIRFDAANKSMDEVKLGFELYPIDRIDFGVDFTYQNNDYDDNRENRTDDTRRSIYFDVGWHAFKKATISAFVGFEAIETDANRITNLENDLTPVYAQTVEDDYRTYGLSLNAPDIIHKLSLNLSYQFQKSDGSVLFDNSITGTSLVDIDESDDYSKKTFEAKATYEFKPELLMTVGYLNESLDFSDIAFANYQYILGSDYYSGIYFDQNYDANVIYATVTYKF